MQSLHPESCVGQGHCFQWAITAWCHYTSSQYIKQQVAACDETLEGHSILTLMPHFAENHGHTTEQARVLADVAGVTPNR
jgi:hypothetical protein